MATVLALVRFLNRTLGIRNIPDPSYNGVQAGSGNKSNRKVSKVGFAVDATMESLAKARERGCQMLVVHHGVHWRGQRDVFGLRKRAQDYCRKNRLTLYAVHLPLDLHPEYGHNYQTALALGLNSIEPFAGYNGIPIGFKGSAKSIHVKSLAAKLDRITGGKSRVLANSRAKASRIGIVTGGGGSALFDAYREGLDVLITGEVPYSIALLAREAGISLILGGHYFTEQIGLKALAALLEQKFNITTAFFRLPVIT